MAAPISTPLRDAFGRVASDLRISVVDRCNLRCTYCMPAEGLAWLHRDELLTVDEIEVVARLFVGLGVREIKLTGGEPTVRRELVEIVGRLRAISGELDLSLTTNGLLLDRLARPLKEAGLDRVTVSCDSLLRHRFGAMTRRDALDRVLAGMAAAEEAGLSPVKVNCVVLAGTNDDEVVDFAEMARQTGRDIRFIEYMPLDADHAWERAKVLPSRLIRQAIGDVHKLVPLEQGSNPATTFAFADGAPGTVGFISSVTEPFCASCNRVRLTAEGQLRVCLFSREETDLRAPLRAGTSADELEAAVRGAVWKKWAGHQINHPDFTRPARSMSMIGG
jgi:cyclic pyranopterin phosphate synthase